MKKVVWSILETAKIAREKSSRPCKVASCVTFESERKDGWVSI
jgi:hypothetical protein